jgi:hypothetical protein
MSTVSQHPIYQLLRDSSSRTWTEDNEAINALDVNPGARERISHAAKLANALALNGEMQTAQDVASESAEDIIATLPERQQAADYLEVAEETPDGPEALAERVRRW